MRCRPMTKLVPKQPTPKLEPGMLVRYWKKGWRFGRLTKLGYRWGHVLHLGRSRRIRIEDIQPYAN